MNAPQVVITANEKLAWCLTIVAWFSVVFMYVGHVSTAILGNMNL